MPTSDPLLLAFTALVGVLAVARATRLVTADTYPPALWVRSRWLRATEERPGTWREGWAELVTCPFCAAPYLTAADGAFWWFSDAHWTWWALNVWLAAAYVAAMVVARDEPCDCP